MCAVSFSLLMSSPALTLPKLSDLSFPHLNTNEALHLGSQNMSYVGGREGMSQEYHRKFSEYKQAAQAGNADAQYSLAVAYEYGMGVSKNKRTTSSKQEQMTSLRWQPLSADAKAIVVVLQSVNAWVETACKVWIVRAWLKRQSLVRMQNKT